MLYCIFHSAICNCESYDEFIEAYEIEEVNNLVEFAAEKLHEFYEYINGEGMHDVAEGIISSIENEATIMRILEDHGYYMFFRKVDALNFLKKWFNVPMVLVNQHGDIVCRLKLTKNGSFYKIPPNVSFPLMLEGDTFTVKMEEEVAARVVAEIHDAYKKGASVEDIRRDYAYALNSDTWSVPYYAESINDFLERTEQREKDEADALQVDEERLAEINEAKKKLDNAQKGADEMTEG